MTDSSFVACQRVDKLYDPIGLVLQTVYACVLLESAVDYLVEELLKKQSTRLVGRNHGGQTVGGGQHDVQLLFQVEFVMLPSYLRILGVLGRDIVYVVG